MAPAEATRERLAQAVEPAWLTRQRWFRAKRRQVVGVDPHDTVRIPGTDGWLVVVTVRYADGDGDADADRYLVPLVISGDEVREPADGDGVWHALAGRIHAGGELPGSRGTFAFEPTQALGDPSSDAEGERRLGVEQSNTSVVLGERLILKLYRLLEAGTNPDVEVSAFLTAAGFPHTPALAGSAAYLPDDDASCSAAMLQAFLPADGDGWAWLLRTLGEPDGRRRGLDGIRRIGEITAELHRALASRPDHPDFPAREATRTELADWQSSAERQVDAALASLDAEERDRLSRVAPRIRERMRVLGGSQRARTSRIHGDFHLGQLLHTRDGFAVIDFEGEPARPLAERRHPASPLRDVAGMLRSFDYAAQTMARTGQAADWERWLEDARAAFLDAYGDIGPSDAHLLAAFELEKACYEVHYEANNRPDWTWLPLDALERLTS